MNCDVFLHDLRSPNNAPVLYSYYCISFFIRDVRGEFGLVHVPLFDLSAAIMYRKVGDFFCLESGDPVDGDWKDIELLWTRVRNEQRETDEYSCVCGNGSSNQNDLGGNGWTMYKSGVTWMFTVQCLQSSAGQRTVVGNCWTGSGHQRASALGLP